MGFILCIQVIKHVAELKTLDSVSLHHLYSQGSLAGSVGLFLTTIITQQFLTQENITKLKTITRD